MDLFRGVVALFLLVVGVGGFIFTGLESHRLGLWRRDYWR